MRNKVLFFGCLLAGVVGVGILSLFPKTLFPIRHLNCTVHVDPCSDLVISTLQPLIGSSLLFDPLESHISQLPLSGYELVGLKKKLPSTLILQFKPQTSLYIIDLENGEQWAIAESGYAQTAQSQDTLPHIKISSHWAQPISNQQVDSNIQQIAYPLISALTTYNVAVKNITFNNPTEIVLHLSDNRIAIASHDNIGEQIRKLSVVLQEVEFSSLETPIHTIDIRFTFPVLKS